MKSDEDVRSIFDPSKPALAVRCHECGGKDGFCLPCGGRGYVVTRAGRELVARLVADGIIPPEAES